MRKVGAIALLCALALVGCSGSDDGSGVSGTYVDDNEGTLTLDEKNGAVLKSGDQTQTFTYEHDGDEVTLKTGDAEATAKVVEDDLVFAPGEWNDEEQRFEKQ